MKNYKKAVIGIGVVVSTLLVYNIGKKAGYSNGYSQGFEDTRTEIRQNVVGTHRMIIDKANDASHFWWITKDTNKVFTLGDEYKFEKYAYDECDRELSDLIDYRIDRLTAKDVKESAELDKIYNFK